MQRTVMELQGISCIELEQACQPKKQIISSRSSGSRVTDLEALTEAMSDYLQNAVKRLREINPYVVASLLSLNPILLTRTDPFIINLSISPFLNPLILLL